MVGHTNQDPLAFVRTLVVINTVEPPNKGHFGSGDFVLYLEAVLWWEVRITIVSTRVIPIGAVALHRGCPLVGGSIIRGSTVFGGGNFVTAESTTKISQKLTPRVYFKGGGGFCPPPPPEIPV